MSIVTNFQAVPSRLLSVYAAVAETENGVLRENLESWATPPSLSTRGAAMRTAYPPLYSPTRSAKHDAWV
jgi:hypothetical protein